MTATAASAKEGTQVVLRLRAVSVARTVRSPRTQPSATADAASSARYGVDSGSQRIREPVVAKMITAAATATAINGKTGMAANNVTGRSGHVWGTSRSMRAWSDGSD